jgi:hypothetical protein
MTRKQKTASELVFCSKCKFYGTYYLGQGVYEGTMTETCMNKIKTHNYLREWEIYQNPSELNKNNDCQLFEVKQ